LDERLILSVVVPIYNEAGNIPELVSRLTVELESLCVAEGEKSDRYELLLVDDGSADDSWGIIERLHMRDPRVKGLRFARNFGHHFAITAGLDFANGDAVVLMDGDLQDPPEEIHRLYTKYKEGYDVVYAIRRNRQDHLAKKLLSNAFWKIINKLSKIDMPINQAMLRILRRDVVDVLNGMRESARFMHGMIAWVGFRVAQLEINHGSRMHGESKYNLIHQIRLAWHAITAFSVLPLRLAMYLGFSAAFISFLVGVYYIYLKFAHGFPVSGWASIMVTVFFMGGVQLFMLGTFGEYLGKLYRQSQQRPLYIVMNKLL